MIQPPDKLPHGHILRRIAASSLFHWAELILAVLLISPLPMWSHGACAAILSIIVALGALYRIFYPEEECECFGSITPISTGAFAALSILIVGLAGFVIMASSQQPYAIAPVNLWFLGVTLVFVILIERKLRYDHLSGSGYAGKRTGIKKISNIPSSLELGVVGGQAITVAELAKAGQPILLVGISTHCPICRLTFEQVVKAGEVLSNEVKIGVITERGGIYDQVPMANLVQLVDNRSRLGRFLGIRARPFAVYLSEKLDLQLPPVTGAKNIEKFLSILGGLVVERK